MAEARYYRRMKREHQGPPAFDLAKCKKTKPFDESSAKLPHYPEFDGEHKRIRYVLSRCSAALPSDALPLCHSSGVQ